MDEHCFVITVAVTAKNENLVKMALNSRKLKDLQKRRPYIPNMEELLNQISLEITRD